MLLKSVKTLLGFGLLGVVSAWMGCSDASPVAPQLAGKSLAEATDDSHFTDSNLEAAVRTALGFPQGRYITVVDIASLTVLRADNKDIRSLTGLGHALSLDTLSLVGNRISDLQPLARLTNLKELYLQKNEISNLSPLASLTNLKQLWLNANAISDVSPLASLTNLKHLWLDGAKIRERPGLDPYYDAASLMTFSDVSPLASLTNLDTLSLGYNPQITDVSSLASLTTLEFLRLNSTGISDLKPLICMTNLKKVSLARNALTRRTRTIYIPAMVENGTVVGTDNTTTIGEDDEDDEDDTT